jgi:hypothetical protein
MGGPTRECHYCKGLGYFPKKEGEERARKCTGCHGTGERVYPQPKEAKNGKRGSNTPYLPAGFATSDGVHPKASTKNDTWTISPKLVKAVKELDKVLYGDLKVEKITVKSESRPLKTRYTSEVAQDLESISSNLGKKAFNEAFKLPDNRNRTISPDDFFARDDKGNNGRDK